MKNIISLFVFILLGFLSTTSNGQLVRDLHTLYSPTNYYQHQTDSSSFEPWRSNSSGSPSYSFEVGTSFSSFGGGNGFSSSYISPTVSFMATERLQIVAGGRFSQYNFASSPMFANTHDAASESNTPGTPTEAFAYGRYQVNNKLSVYSLGAFGKNQPYYNPFGSSPMSTADYQHVSFGMDYKISNKVSIGASFGVTNGPAWGTPLGGGLRNQSMNPFFP